MTSARVPIAALFLCALIMLVPLAFAPALFEPFLEIKELLLVAGAATAAALWLATGGLALPRTPVWFGVAVMAGAAALSPFRAAAAAHFAALLLLLVVTASVMGEPAARAALAGAITVAGCIEAVYVLWQAFVGDPVFFTARLEGKWRAFGTLGNPNWAGEFLAVALLVGWGRFTARRGWPGAACLLVIAMGLAATFARGAWLACGVGALAFQFARRKRGATPELLVLTAGISVAVAAAVLVTRPDTVAHLANIASLRGRVWMWIVTAAMIRSDLWGGCGLGNFGMTFPGYQAEAFSRPWSAPFLTNGSFTAHAHNDLLQLWAEAGLAAAVALAALAWMAARRGRALAGDPLALGCWAALMALLVDAAFASPVYFPASGLLLAVLLGTVEAAACRDTVWKVPSTAPARAAACLLAAVLCAIAWPYCWGRARAGAALGRASAALGRSDLNGADAALQAAFRDAPDHMEAWSLAGRLHFLRGEYPASAEAFERALRLGYDADIFEAKAGALWKFGRRAEAVAVLEELVRLRPGLPWAARELKLLRAASSRP